METELPFSIVRADRFIEATRSSGYKSTSSALAELVDNSLQAEAKNIAISFINEEPVKGGKGKPAKPRVKYVVISDDGRGMDAETLRRALRFGDGSRFNDRQGLGRFGMGLPNASVSQCRRVDVYTWTRGGKSIWTYLDVDAVARGEMREIPEPKPKSIPAEFSSHASSPSGTIVVWSDCTDLDCDRVGEAIAKIVRTEFGRIYRYFLASKVVITVDSVPIRPVDPLFLMPEASLDGDLAEQHGETLKFAVPIPGKPDQTSTVEVVFSLLPTEWQKKWGGQNPTREQEAEIKKRQIAPANRCVSIVRAGREMDFVKDLYRKEHWTAKWYKAEIRFEPELDECFQITHTKQHARVRLGSVLDNIIQKTVDANLSTLKGKVQNIANQRPKRSEISQAERVVKAVESRLKPIADLQMKSEPKVRAEVKQFVDRVAQQTGAPPDEIARVEELVSRYPVLIRTEMLPGAPFYRVETIGRATVAYLNTHHPFYNALYRRLEQQSPEGKTALELMVMALARCESHSSDDGREWYEIQRQEWSQTIKAYLEQLPEFEPNSDGATSDEVVEEAHS